MFKLLDPSEPLLATTITCESTGRFTEGIHCVREKTCHREYSILLGQIGDQDINIESPQIFTDKDCEACGQECSDSNTCKAYECSNLFSECRIWKHNVPATNQNLEISTASYIFCRRSNNITK